MKKLKCFLLAAALILIFCSCSRSKPAAIELIYNENRVEYDVSPSNIKLYNGNLYAAHVSELTGEAQISVFDGDGKKIREITLSDLFISNWDISDGIIYLISDTGWGNDRRITLYSYDINTEATEEICDFDNMRFAPKIRAMGDKLYYLGLKQEYEEFDESFETDNNSTIVFSSQGSAFGCVDLNTGEITESDIPYPIRFSERNGRIIVYIYEKGKGYGFYDYTANSMICYTNKLDHISDFEIINDNMDFVFIHSGDISPYRETLSFSGMDDKSGIIQLDDEIYPVGFSSEGDYLCVLSAKSLYDYSGEFKVYKYFVNISTADPPIRVITASELTMQTPLFSCGYQIQTDLLSQNGFSLTVLSLDKAYDIVMMSSIESYANEIKSKGSFYPLNDIPGVKEYMDGCFPGLKETATNADGDIWMLPVSVDVPIIRYNVKNCAEKGISFSSDLSDFISNINKASDYPEYFFSDVYTVVRSMLTSYLSENDSFDTDAFRSLAGIIRENYFNKALRNNSKVLNAFYNNMLLAKGGYGSPDSELYKEIYDKALFAMTPYLTEQKNSIGDENLLAAPIPTVNGVNSAYCTFICVNPNSDHLEETLLFVEKTVSRFANKKNNFTLADKAFYDSDPYTQSLYDIYANSRISFTVPWEIYQDDFESYAKGMIELEDFIAEADRKLSAYLNE